MMSPGKAKLYWQLKSDGKYFSSENPTLSPSFPPLLNGGFFIANVTVKFLFTTHYCKQYEPNRAPEHRIKVLREFLEG